MASRKNSNPEYITTSLGSGWVSILCPDGSILIQYHKEVLEVPSGHVLDLTELNEINRVEIKPDSLWVRTVHLTPDGLVHAEAGAISRSGIPSSDSKPLTSSPLSAFQKFIKAFKFKNQI